jgi:hypothetical protein
MKGTYVFYQDGKEIYRSPNVITKFGKRFITSFIAGNASFNSKDLALGIANGTEYPVLDTNSRLGFEVYRSPVNFGSIDIQTSNGESTYGVVYKTTIPQNISGIINEVGLYMGSRTSINQFDSKFLSAFDDNTLWYDLEGYNPAYVTSPSARIGNNMAKWEFKPLDTTSTTREFIQNVNEINMMGYSVNDTLTVAFYRVDTNSSKIRIKFYSSDTEYYYVDIDSLSGTGHKIVEIPMSELFLDPQGSNPSLLTISKIGIELTRSSASSECAINFDGIRINDEDTFDPTFGMISRSVLTTPITKLTGRQIDIEYRIDLGF